MTADASVLAIHGAGAGAWEWAIWQRCFELAGWRFTAVDLPLAAHRREMALADIAVDDDLAFLREARARDPQAVLLGASLGAAYAQKLAAERAAADLLLVGAVPAFQVPGFSAKSWPTLVTWADDPQLARTARALPDVHPADWAYAHRRWRDESGAVLRQAWGGLLPHAVPLGGLVLAGALDEDTPPTLQRQLAQAIGAEYQEVSGASHAGLLLGRHAVSAALRCLAYLERSRAVRVALASG